MDYNLIDRPWIQVFRNGKVAELSLLDALSDAHEIRCLWGSSPVEVVGQRRILLAVLYRAFAPKTTDAWFELWRAGRWPRAPIEEYLRAWESRFDLFSERSVKP